MKDTTRRQTYRKSYAYLLWYVCTNVPNRGEYEFSKSYRKAAISLSNNYFHNVSRGMFALFITHYRHMADRTKYCFFNSFYKYSHGNILSITNCYR